MIYHHHMTLYETVRLVIEQNKNKKALTLRAFTVKLFFILYFLQIVFRRVNSICSLCFLFDSAIVTQAFILQNLNKIKAGIFWRNELLLWSI